jgi:hypothetical protein
MGGTIGKEGTWIEVYTKPPIPRRTIRPGKQGITGTAVVEIQKVTSTKEKFIPN